MTNVINLRHKEFLRGMCNKCGVPSNGRSKEKWIFSASVAVHTTKIPGTVEPVPIATFHLEKKKNEGGKD
jgi:hypothetical protein